MLFVVLIGLTIAVPTLSLAMLWPLPLVCICSFGLGMAVEVMMVQWTVALATHIPPDRLARVSSYDALGSTMAMPVGALAAGPARGRDRGLGHAVRGGRAHRGVVRARPHPAADPDHALADRPGSVRAEALRGVQAPMPRAQPRAPRKLPSV